jgi:peptidoglycan/LPS O-acetylase OafA/YrhL
LIYKNLIHQFKRSTSNSNFIPEIDGLRFYAIITVVIYHLNTAFSREIGLNDLGLSLLGGKNTLGSFAWWLVRLDLGVKVFFAISGMVLALPFLKHYLFNSNKVNIRDYYYRRLTRLEPPFVLSLFFFLGVHVFLLDISWNSMLPHLFSGLLYSHVFIFGEPNPINPVTWSLETEAQFYIVVPLLFASLFFRRSIVWFVFFLCTLFFSSIYLKHFFIQYDLSKVASSVFAYFSNFLVGIVVAWIYLKRKIYFDNKCFIWDIIGLISVLSQFYFYKPQHDYLNNLIFNISIFLMMLAVFKGRIFNFFFTQPLIYIIGGMCYSIYLLHYAFFHLMVRYTSELQFDFGYGFNLLFQISIGLPLILFISALFYLLIEKPCMDKNWPSNFKQFLLQQFSR